MVYKGKKMPASRDDDAFDYLSTNRDPNNINGYIKVHKISVISLSNTFFFMRVALKVLFPEVIAEPDESSYSIDW
jgi:hypothetical protein